MTHRIDPQASPDAGTPRAPKATASTTHAEPKSGWLPEPGASARVGDTLVEASRVVGLYVLRRIS